MVETKTDVENKDHRDLWIIGSALEGRIGLANNMWFIVNYLAPVFLKNDLVCNYYLAMSLLYHIVIIQ